MATLQRDVSTWKGKDGTEEKRGKRGVAVKHHCSLALNTTQYPPWLSLEDAAILEAKRDSP